MKTLDHVKTVLSCELHIWFRKQAANVFDDYYLYYLPSTKEHDSGLFIGKEKPANKEYKLAMPERLNKGQTIDQNFNRIIEVLKKLPVLD